MRRTEEYEVVWEQYKPVKVAYNVTKHKTNEDSMKNAEMEGLYSAYIASGRGYTVP